MKGIRILTLVLFIVSSLPQVLWAESVRKIAYINVGKAIDSYYKTEEADKKLEKEGEKKNAERDKMIEDINKLRDETALLSEKAREKKEKELNERLRALQDFDRETRLELKRKRDDMMRDIIKDMDKVVSSYGENENYDIILDARVLLYSNDSIDVTDEIIKILNKNK